MKITKVSWIFLGAFLISVFVVSCEKDELVSDSVTEVVAQGDVAYGKFVSDPIPGQYIVQFTTDFGKSFTNNTVNFKHGIIELKNRVVKEFPKLKFVNEGIYHAYGHSIKGFTAKLTPEQYKLLSADKRVKYIEQDHVISLIKPDNPGKGKGDDVEEAGGQVVPWGIDSIGGSTNGIGKRAWIIDTGIDMDHPDLNVDQTWSISFLTGGPNNLTPDDQNGHGTHVAGTVAAKNNTIGVVGVAAGATVVAVRVLDRKGSGTWSGVLAGINYVGANGIAGEVANMSLGGGASTTIDAAVIAASANVKFAIAAGNSSTNANNSSPARANGSNIYTVSAMNYLNNWAYFSNYGNPPIEYCAPGVAINSTWKNGGYNSISGTSMAAPHVAGLLLLGSVTTNGYVNLDPDGNADPIAHN